MVAFIKKYLGWRNWAVFVYNSIFENLFIIFYISLRTNVYSDEFLIDIFIFLLFSIFSTTYGYLINDYADIDLDKIHGKQNTFSNDSKTKAVLISFLFLALSMVFGFPFSKNQSFVFLWFAWIFITSFYSLPPVRLKERGKTGLIFVVFAQRFIPVLLLFTAFNFPYPAELIFLSVYVFFRGISSDLNHQLEDFENDISTGTKTFAVTSGMQKGTRLLRFSLESEKLILAGILFYMLSSLLFLPVLLYLILVFTTFLYLTMYGYSVAQILRKAVSSVNPFKSDSGIFQFLHHSFPSVILAVTLNIIVTYYNWKFVLLFLLLGYIRGLFSTRIIKNSYIFKFISKVFIKSTN